MFPYFSLTDHISTHDYPLQFSMVGRPAVHGLEYKFDAKIYNPMEK